MLNRVHVKIKTISRQKIDQQICWFLVPETIIGVPKYDQGACIAYLMDKLKISGFNVRYIHPNVLFISWTHWVPSYVRSEIKKKTGIVVNEYGQKVDENGETHDNGQNMIDVPSDPNEYLLKQQGGDDQRGRVPRKEYTPIKSYKPSGSLLYDDDILDKIGNKFT